MKVLILLLCLITLPGGAARAQNRVPEIDEFDALDAKKEGLDNTIGEMQKRLISLIEKLQVIDAGDKAEAARLKAEVERLYPCCPMDGEGDDVFYLSSGYTFRTPDTGDGYDAVVLLYDEEQFSFSDFDGNHGFILDLGKIPLESVGEKTPQLAALAKYKPPFDTKEIKKEFTADRITFGDRAAVRVGDTYLLRAVSYAFDGNLDNIYALRVARRDTDGSIIVFIKKLKDFPLPAREKEKTYALPDVYETGVLIKLREFLRTQDLKDIRVDYVERKLVVTGTLPKGKLAALKSFIESLDLSPDTKYEVIEK